MRPEKCVRHACVTVFALVVSAGSVRALPASPQQMPGATTETELSSPLDETTAGMTAVVPRRTSPPVTWPRVLVPDPVAHYAARKALDDAWRLLAQPRCSAVMIDLRDASGRPLVDRLQALSVDPQMYLSLLVFVDGTRERACVPGVLAFTTPGSRVVGLCPDELKRTARDPHRVAARLIHEMLHTLGLGENPPSSQEITRRVLEACQRRP